MNPFSDIKSVLRQWFHSGWIIPPVGVVALILLYQVGLDLSRGMPPLGVMRAAPAGKEEIPLSQVEPLSRASYWTGPLEPLIPLPPPAPPPVVPTKTKITLIYQGFMETESGRQLAYIKAADKQIIGTNGAIATADYVIAAFDLKTLTLRNASQTNLLRFNTPTEVEVPLK